MISTTALRDYIREKGSCSEHELSRQFKISETMVAMMAERLEAKGQLKLIVQRHEEHSCDCAFCGKEKDRRLWQYVG